MCIYIKKKYEKEMDKDYTLRFYCKYLQMMRGSFHLVFSGYYSPAMQVLRCAYEWFIMGTLFYLVKEDEDYNKELLKEFNTFIDGKYRFTTEYIDRVGELIEKDYSLVKTKLKDVKKYKNLLNDEYDEMSKYVHPNINKQYETKISSTACMFHPQIDDGYYKLLEDWYDHIQFLFFSFLLIYENVAMINFNKIKEELVDRLGCYEKIPKTEQKSCILTKTDEKYMKRYNELIKIYCISPKIK